MDKIFKSLSLRLQAAAIMLSVVGIIFALKTYFHIRNEVGAVASEPFLIDFYQQIAVAVAANILVAFLIFNIATRPVKQLTEAMDRLSNNKLDTEVPFQASSTEIGTMARRVQIFKNNALEKQRLEEEQRKEEQRKQEEQRDMLNNLADRFQTSVGEVLQSLNSATGELDTTSKTLRNVVEVTNDKVKAASTATQQASGNVQNVSSAAEELTYSINEISEQVVNSAKIAHEAAEEAAQANEQVKGLAEAMDKIGEITTLIQNIAEQTNLLALNATIESARAGEAGKGFAVVANEVKNLANQTAQATDEISSQITRVQSETREVVQIIEKIGETVRKLDEIASNITGSIEQERAATEEIAHSVKRAADGTIEVSENVSGVSDAAIETGTAADQVVQCVQELASQTKVLNDNVDHFLSDVKSS